MHYSSTRTFGDTLARKLARIGADLAPEDATLAQATHTGTLRRDPTYVARWAAHESAYVPEPPV